MRLFGCCLTALLGAGCAHAAPDRPVTTEAATFRVTQVAGGLAHPWCVAFLPGGDMLVTERPGRLRLVHEGRLRAEPVAGVPKVFAHGQGGLFDVALDPDFAQTRTLYLSYAYADEAGRTTTRVTRARYAPEGLSEQRVILEAQPPIGRQGARPEVYTLGHRNPQGLAVDPRDGTVWEEEHGAMGGDEINRLRPGANYGWPLVAYGKNYDGSTIGLGVRHKAGYEDTVHYWDPPIAPSGLALYLGDKFPGWRGDLLVGALKDQLVSRLHLDAAGRVVREEQFLKGALGRVRDVREGPDGLVYLLTDEDPGGLYRLEPVAEAEGAGPP